MNILARASYIDIVHQALREDVGSGDATTLAVVPADLTVTGTLATREACVCAGMPVAAAVFAELDSASVLEARVAEGQSCPAGTVLGSITGKARAVLTGERVALNFLQRLCGIATMASRYVAAVGPHPTRILDTRKTTPGLRLLEKYAVQAGGADNHRIGLYDRVMIKDNHRELAKYSGEDSIAFAVRRCREQYPRLEIEVEADTLEQVAAAVSAGADYILLDNMTTEQMREAVNLVAGRSRLEASGGITLARVPEIAAAGVDFISVGALTHSVTATDIGLDIEVTV